MNMNQMLRVTILGLAFSVAMKAQALHTVRQSENRWLVDFEAGSKAGLGYKIPHIAFGISLERSFGRRFELQGRASYSPDKKYITNNGNSLLTNLTGLVWVSDRFAISSGFRQSTLWTSQFEKKALAPTIGVVIRERFYDMPGRFYVDYLFPTGCQWGVNCPIQSNRLQGPEGYWEHRLWPHFRLGVQFGFYRILNQSNELAPNIPRTGEWSGEAHALMRYEIHRCNLDDPL
jgi:hypothetical protein